MSDVPDTRKSTKTKFDYDQLNDVQKMYIRRFERFNKSRAVEKKQRLMKIGATGGLLVALVFGIYNYTIYAMKQIQLGPEFDQRASDVEASTKS